MEMTKYSLYSRGPYAGAKVHTFQPRVACQHAAAVNALDHATSCCLATGVGAEASLLTTLSIVDVNFGKSSLTGQHLLCRRDVETP